jgi:hypothetical protein
MRGISWLAANRLASQEGLCCVEWVSEWMSIFFLWATWRWRSYNVETCRSKTDILNVWFTVNMHLVGCISSKQVSKIKEHFKPSVPASVLHGLSILHIRSRLLAKRSHLRLLKVANSLRHLLITMYVPSVVEELYFGSRNVLERSNVRLFYDWQVISCNERRVFVVFIISFLSRWPWDRMVGSVRRISLRISVRRRLCKAQHFLFCNIECKRNLTVLYFKLYHVLTAVCFLLCHSPASLV